MNTLHSSFLSLGILLGLSYSNFVLAEETVPQKKGIRRVGIQLPRQTGKLDGTLDLPGGEGPFPMVIMIAGSGPTDRDGNTVGGIKWDYLKMLAHELADRGIAVLRYDRRGIGRSKAVQPNEDDYRFEMRVDDVAGWVELLRKDQRFSRIGLIGHSMGSLVGILAAQKVKVDAVVALAGLGQRAHVAFGKQLTKNLGAKAGKEAVKILDELAAGRTVENPPRELATLFRPSLQPFLISYFKYDPLREIRKLDMPILVVQGTSDRRHSVDESKRLAGANENSVLVIIEGMNHILKRANNPVEQWLAYNTPGVPLAPELAPKISAFLDKTLRDR